MIQVQELIYAEEYPLFNKTSAIPLLPLSLDIYNMGECDSINFSYSACFQVMN